MRFLRPLLLVIALGLLGASAGLAQTETPVTTRDDGQPPCITLEESQGMGWQL